MGSDPHIDLVESAAAERLGDMKHSQKAAASAIARAQAIGSGLLLASALTAESWAWSNLGEFDKAIDDESRARDLFTAAGNSYEAAIALRNWHVPRLKADSRARKALEDALAEFRRFGAQWNIASCSHHLAEVLQDEGDLEQAKRYLGRGSSNPALAQRQTWHGFQSR